MTNKTRGEVTLELGGESYVLRPEFGVIAGIEAEIGTNLFHVGRRLELADVTARELIDFAHACLNQAGHKLDKERLGELIVEAGTHAVIGTLTQFCHNYAFGGRAEKKANGAAGPAETAAVPEETGTGKETSSASS